MHRPPDRRFEGPNDMGFRSARKSQLDNARHEQHSPGTSDYRDRFFIAFPSPTLSLPTFRHLRKVIHYSYLPPTNYSFKVVFRASRDIHSVPAKQLEFSDWNIPAPR
jgi:hypothetical protein